MLESELDRMVIAQLYHRSSNYRSKFSKSRATQAHKMKISTGSNRPRKNPS